VILHCNYEELRAIASAAELLAAEADAGESLAVAAPPDALARIERLVPRLTGDISIETLDDQRHVQEAVSYITRALLTRLDARVIETTPANEEAVNLYFDYAHARAVLARLEQMGAEMAAILELISGGGPTEKLASSVTFPD
jgi:hypothetical protein